MKTILTYCLLFMTVSLFGQNRVNPIIPEYGGIFEIPEATEKPDPNIKYNIVIEIVTGSDPTQHNDALNNVARLINLHAMGGVPKKNIHIVLAIHGSAIFTLLNNEQYQIKYGVDNPNIKLLEAFKESGIVDIFACGQSMRARKIQANKMVPMVGVATSMLTTVTTHQLKGYAMLKF